jgi:hypothetical protein
MSPRSLLPNPPPPITFRHSTFQLAVAATTSSVIPSCGVVVAVQAATTLDVWPGSHRSVWALACGAPAPHAIVPKLVCVPAGCALLFRGDLLHAGSAYTTSDNARLHAVLDAPNCPERDDGGTHPAARLRGHGAAFCDLGCRCAACTKSSL